MSCGQCGETNPHSSTTRRQSSTIKCSRSGEFVEKKKQKQCWVEVNSQSTFSTGLPPGRWAAGTAGVAIAAAAATTIATAVATTVATAAAVAAYKLLVL